MRVDRWIVDEDCVHGVWDPVDPRDFLHRRPNCGRHCNFPASFKAQERVGLPHTIW